MTKLAGLLGLSPDDMRSTRALGAVIGLDTLAEFLVEGVATAAFLARIGAALLPLAMAARALAEVVASLAYGRLARRWSPQRTLRGVGLVGAVAIAACAAVSGSVAGVWAAFVCASVLARLRVIHFGVLALEELEGGAAPRVLPVVYGCARVGAIVAGPVLALAAGPLGMAPLLVAAAAVYALSASMQGRWLGDRAAPKLPRSDGHHGSVRPPSLREDDEAPPSLAARVPRRAPRWLLAAILVGSGALAAGRIALRTQSGAILEASFTEAHLASVLGVYFAVAGTAALLLQLGVVGRVLSADGLPWLNLGWAGAYLGAQVLLAFGPATVVVALAALLVEKELRNAVRTPVANLLYEAMPPERRAPARTLVIGVTIPLVSLAVGLALGTTGAPPAALAAVGISAAVVLALAAWAQNRAWRASPGAG